MTGVCCGLLLIACLDQFRVGDCSLRGHREESRHDSREAITGEAPFHSIVDLVEIELK
jgi:hypothetical protein